MTNRKSTKKALLSSILSLVLCLTMLIGTTFAWFTDSVTSTNNIIKSGNLDVELEYSTDMNNWSKVTSETNVFKKDALWEPGYTEVVYLRVSNLGSLALKYNLGVNVASETAGINKAGESFKLSDYIEFGVIDPVSAAYVDRDAARADVTGAKKISEGYTKEGSLLAKAQGANEYPSNVVAMVVYMPESVGNEANHNGTAPVVNLGLNLLATQLTAEEDSFDNQYDKDAVYADAYVTNATELAEAIAEGGTIALMNDIEIPTTVVAKGVSTVINLNGNNLTSTTTKNSGNQYAIQVKGKLDIVGTGEVSVEHTGSNMGWNALVAAISVEGGELTLGEGVTVVNEGGSDMAYAVDVNSTLGATTLNIDGAVLSSPYTAVRLFNNHKTAKATVNLNSGYVDGGSRDIWVHNPSAAAVDANGVVNIADDYDYTVSIQDTSYNGRIYQFGGYAVVFEDEKLDEAISAGATELVLGAGNYIIPDSAQGKTLSIVGTGDTNIATQDDGSYEGCDYSLDGATVTFENVTITTDGHTYTGYARLNATYNNCVINNTYTLYEDSVFNNCTFNVSGDSYNIWTWGASKAEFNACTFNTSGKAILLYGGTNTDLIVNNCVFNDDNAYANVNNKAAIEVGTDWSTDKKTVTVTKTTVNGFDVTDKGISTGTTLWGNKNSMSTDRLNVVIDGVDVY